MRLEIVGRRLWPRKEYKPLGGDEDQMHHRHLGPAMVRRPDRAVEVDLSHMRLRRLPTEFWA